MKNRKIYEDGSVIHDDFGLLECFYTDICTNIVSVDSEDIQNFNKWAKIFGIELIGTTPVDVDHERNQNHWFLPKEFIDFNIEQYLIELCTNEKELNRVNYEIQLFKERNLLILLKYILYLVSVFRDNNIVWGVGRGSSVSSYVLFLLGLHKIDSIKYDLDVREFLK